MGRERWWKGGLELLVLCFLQGIVHGDNEVGCLFSKNVCRSGVETCYDDSLFGRCVRPFGDNEEDDYRYDLGLEELEILRRRLESLALGGYEWTHPYTQCVMQGSLHSLRYRLTHDVEFCRGLAELDESNIDEYGDDVDVEPEEEPQPLAVVNFTPTRGHGYGDFADEKYYPPVSSKKPKHNFHHDLSDDNEDDYTYAYSSFLKNPERQRIAKLEDINGNDEIIDDDDSMVETPENSMKVNVNLDDLSKHFRKLAERMNDQPMYRLRRQPFGDENSLRSFKPSKINIDYGNSMKNILRDSDRDNNAGRYQSWRNSLLNKDIWRFIMMNATLQKRYTGNLAKLEFMKDEGKGAENEDEDDGWMNRDTGDEESEAQEDDNQENAPNEEISPLSFVDLSNNLPQSGMYTEGGLVQPLDRHIMRDVPANDDIVFDDDLRLLWSRDLAAFQRPERLDVKKPGPLFSTNNYAFKTQSPAAPFLEDSQSSDREENEVPRAPLVKKQLSHSADDGQTHENVDLDHVYIQFNSVFDKWIEGERVVDELAKLLGVSRSLFTNDRVGRAEVTFKVNGQYPNDANGIASRIDGISEELQKVTGREIKDWGIGDKVKLPPHVRVKRAPATMSRELFAGLVLAGAACAAAAAVVTLIIARRHAKSRAKLAGLATPDPEASKDYQDLCRARMQAKQPNEKPESPRIISLSRESESNRSSTSSWGEEAAALTNMDIATGHMVLTYMEDHLKNKDRLDQEWAAICAYEAEPSSVAIASEKCNADRNRPGSSLPYDHSRIVLNDLSNANNSDYINASTITDHDPRNPAYIATQGPLPQTSADFWQLVWEQGSVVIVMLTRLTEEGRGMCHRYWPEEGSELYHIYEVHLVSEHIWCDDYLVRSFYLKNLRTGETRTVTQFHFLSWPENGVPQSTKALLEFRRKVNKSYRGRSCPIVVHCSDGAGRTGTYCLIDMVLNRMAKGAKEIDIAAALEHIRDQRPGMVATKQQFEFVLVAVAEEVHAILKALPVQTITEKSQSAGAASSHAQSSSGSEQ